MTRTRNASKSSSNAAASNKQQNLLHFYHRKFKPVDDVAEDTEVLSARKSVPSSPHGRSEPVALLLRDGKIASRFASVETEAKQHQSLDESISSTVIGSNIPQMTAVLQEPQRSFSDSKIIVVNLPGDPTEGELRMLETDSSMHAVLTDSTSPLSGRKRTNDLDKPPFKEPYPIFKQKLPSLSKALTNNKKLLPNKCASSSKMSLEPRRKSKVNKGRFGTDTHNVNDLPELSDQENLNPSTPAVASHFCSPITGDDPRLRGSQDAPIELSFSPQSQGYKVVHPFFARRVVEPKEEDRVTPPLTTPLRLDTPWPESEQQHIRGPQTCFRPSAPLSFPAYRGPSPQTWFPPQPSLSFLENRSATPPLFSDIKTFVPTSHVLERLEREEIISRMPTLHRGHSAISRLLNMDPESHHTMENGEMWTYRWRPRSAAEVLGNEENLRYIKDWLQALEIRTGQILGEYGYTKGKSKAPIGAVATKRPAVIRTVDNKRRRKRRKVESDDESSLGDWIVQEDEEEEITTEDDLLCRPSSPSNEDGSVPSSKVGTASSSKRDKSRPTEFAQLTNTILLTGPPGSGKTASVYACAEELGWEVFEVYPGIGKRSSANISSLVGDVAKNHLVGTRGASGSGPKGGSIQSFIKSGFGYLTEDHHRSDTVPEGGHCGVRQSIILLEEVDVLFKDDANFWPAVVNIIKYSHRPVFMTCNDVSLVPRDDLPLQTTLQFQPCPHPLAISFLQSVCLAEGRAVPRSQLDVMYSATHELIGPDQPDAPQLPFPSQLQACWDLRHVLTELQFWCQRESFTKDGTQVVDETLPIIAGPSTEVLADWSRPEFGESAAEEVASQGYDVFQIWKHIENVSYVDGYLARRSSDILEALAIDRYRPSGDDEIGHALLEKSSGTEFPCTPSCFTEDEAISRDVLSKSRHVLEASGAGPRVRTGLLGSERGSTFDFRSLMRDRATNQLRVVSYLDDVMPLSAPLLPLAPAVLEYAAYLRQMVSADDELESAGRETRRRRRFQDRRYLMLSAEGEDGARRTRVGAGLS